MKPFKNYIGPEHHECVQTSNLMEAFPCILKKVIKIQRFGHKNTKR